MSWEVKITPLGASEVEEYTVDGESISDAVSNALEAAGLADNDEGFLTLEISGESDNSDDSYVPGGRKKNA